MDLMAQVDAYCERLGPGLWAEPLNALTNLAFIAVALALWRAVAGLPLARLLCLVLFVIGVGSGLFHTLATGWAGIADTLPILLFILIYIFAATRHFFSAPLWVAVLIPALFLPASVLLTPVLRLLPLYGASAAYMPVPLLIFLYAALLAKRAPATAGRLAAGAALLMLSLTFRSLDAPLCDATDGIGTHFLWHLLNATMLGWMILTYRFHMQTRHMLAGGALRR
ncbi:hypothetical protein DL237_17320 [Pseudooceanicola sediminis]|uniref:Ceramidase n=1 Tax=Pseudooceanicola sediminis TaxID=2211117 RepID=A0A399IWS0_9RHOB|nr:ceramidase domain-containing protein [Pseudooceanicola sediminis]KAA2312381.1 ceramidase [Puniceibacterium sp. HSS470]RII37430.1 hypothetical protein DL237_17320 [Pseudooceanicola sediminis]|tara:strand:- start:10350 stop:11024 length:675 start_codon:yes stop_codon:yes gene_type:complete